MAEGEGSGEGSKTGAAGSIAVAVTVVVLSIVLRQTTDLAFGWRLLMRSRSAWWSPSSSRDG